jgi:FtsP/CotA-like multicopper oxidase with cupredoxin domain
MTMVDRRALLKLAGTAPLLAAAPWALSGAWAQDKPDYTLRIARGLVELAPDHIVTTTLYNDQFPGPLLRLTEDKPVVVDVVNDTDAPELLHWHGQFLPSDVDGAAEEGSPVIPARGMRRLAFTPKPAGFRYYHSHVAAGPDLDRGTYTGLAGPVYIEPKRNPGAYDREIFLVLKEFAPSLSRGGDMDLNFLAGPVRKPLEMLAHAADAEATEKQKGFEVGYSLFAINGKMLGQGEPIRVRPGERVLFHVLNASATEIRSLALPLHRFRVVALDGNPVPTPQDVPVLWLGTGERVSAIVEMRHPGTWVLGDLADDDRKRGMGVVVEYAGHHGQPVWFRPRYQPKWDYAGFGRIEPVPTPDQIIELTIVKENGASGGFNRWTLNGDAFSMETMTPAFKLEQGRRYRLRLNNASDDIHPVHLHRHSFELTQIAGRASSGVLKDVVMLGGFQSAELDFIADNPGPSLFHCHQQLHMDFGFMALFSYA